MIDRDQLLHLVCYDPSTGVFTRKVATGANKRFPAGSSIGNPGVRGYGQIRIAGRIYMAHRLAWLYMTGEWPDWEIDHINGQPSDNRYENLRIATHSQNGKNIRRNKANTTGYKGVSLHRQTGKFCAKISPDGRSIHLGLFDCPAAAYFSYIAAADRHFKEFCRAA